MILYRMSVFSGVEKAASASLFRIATDFRNDEREFKLNLAQSAYRTEEGSPYVLPVVRAIEAVMAADSTLNHEYLPILGLAAFRDAAVRFCLGKNSAALIENRVAGIRTISGTGALRLAADFLKTTLQNALLLLPDPTWPNHRAIFSSAGFANIGSYRFWNAKEKSFDFEGCLEDLKNAPENSIVLLHGSSHNPTGLDPSCDQWKQIAAVLISKGHFCIFDSALQVISWSCVQKLNVTRGSESMACILKIV